MYSVCKTDCKHLIYFNEEKQFIGKLVKLIGLWNDIINKKKSSETLCGLVIAFDVQNDVHIES